MRAPTSASAPATSTTARKPGRSSGAPPISRRWRSSATAASCSIPTRRASRRSPVCGRSQVAHVGTDARALLEHFANDPKFHGLLIVGMADTMYFGMPVIGLGGTAIHNYAKNDKPAQLTGCGSTAGCSIIWRSWIRITGSASSCRGSTTAGARVSTVRTKTSGKSERFPGRQFFMWDRIESRPICGAMRATRGTASRGRISAAVADKVIARSAEAVRRIRARGGDVIFIRPPSAPQLRVNEQHRIPRALGWDRLLVGAKRRASMPTTCRRRRTWSFPNGHISAAGARRFSPMLMCGDWCS